MFDTLHDNLCDTYEETRYKPVGAEWPPNQPKSIVSVALIHYKGKRTRQELFAIAQRHKDGSIAIDQIMSSNGQAPAAKKQRLDHSRVTKDIADIFTADPMDQTEDSTDLNKPPKRILIEGAPGIGKTVLVKEIAYRWANKELLQNIELVFLIYLRDPRLREIKSITQLLQLFTSTKVATDVADYLQEYNGSGVAFVIDGFDEYPSSLQHSSLIVGIIRGDILHKAMVVVTSRPTSTVSLHDHVDRRIDILGFAKEEREQYIIQSLSDCPEKKDKLFNYLKRQPTINGFCYVPLHLAVLLYLFQQGGKLPETLTEMNESFIIHTVYRHLKRHEPSSLEVLNKLIDLPKPILNVVHKISQIAFKGLQENQLVFTADEIKEMCPDINDTPGAINGFGLLQTVQHYPQEGAGETASFNFLHYTMQEFLAAFHVSTLSDEEQSSLMEETFWKERFNFMWMMYVGIVGTQSKLFIDFISKGNVYKKKSGVRVSSEIQKDKRKRLHLFQCYTEANSKADVPDIIASMFKDGKIKITDITLLPNHISSLVSFLSHSSIQLKMLNLKNCNCGDIGMNIVEQYITDSKETTSTLEYVDLMGNNSSPWNVYCAVIKQCSVSNLTLCGDRGMEEFAVNMDNCLSMNTALQSLTLCEIGNTGLNIIKTLLSNNKLLHLDELNLSWKNISSKATDNSNVLLQTKFPVSNEMTDSRAVTVNVLWDGTNVYTLDSLNLSGQCEKNVVPFISFALCKNKKVCTLDISDNNISDLGAQEMARALHENQALQTLNISCNNIQVDGAKEIAETLLENSALQKLDISNNYLHVGGAKVLAEVLCENKVLQILDVSNNKILADGAVAISECIKKNSTLQQLVISGNNIGTEGTIKIAEAVKINTTLQNLDISNNNISNDGAMAFSDCLKHNNSLQELNLSRSEITDEKVKQLSEAIRINMVLLKLNISKNLITAEGIVNLLEVIKCNSVLKTLIITHNNVTKCGLIKIEQCIKKLSSPLEVFVSWNEIKDENAAVFKSTIRCLLHNSDNDTVKSSDIKEDEWHLQNISKVEYRVTFLCDCLKEDNTLQSLRLHNNKIFTHENSHIANVMMIAKTIQINTKIQKLDMSHNSISNNGTAVICDILMINESLREINLKGNSITQQGAITLSKAIQVSNTLQKLNLSVNKISDDGAAAISDSLKINVSLQELNLAWNNITNEGANKIAEAIQATKTLQKLDLSINKISDDGAAAISDSLKINVSLQELNLASNNITTEGAKKIAEAIQVTKTLQKLILDSNNIYDDGAAAISDSLKINVSLQELDLGGNKITTEGAKKIAEAIQVTKTLQKLILVSNKIRDDGAAAIGNSLMINASLQELNLAWNNITDKGAKRFSEAIQVTTTLQKLNLDGNHISDDGVVAISDTLKINVSLRELSLHQNNITDKGAIIISETIQVTTTLQKLYLHGNKISNDGATAISNSLKINNSLQKLSLHFNYIVDRLMIKSALHFSKLISKVADDGVASISDSLKINVSLQELDLSANQFTDKGAKKIAEAIQVTTKLQKLDLSSNKISDDGAEAISASLKINVSLQELNLSSNEITDKGAQKISEAIHVTTMLQKLDLRGNNISDNGITAINDSLVSLPELYV